MNKTILYLEGVEEYVQLLQSFMNIKSTNIRGNILHIFIFYICRYSPDKMELYSDSYEMLLSQGDKEESGALWGFQPVY